MKRSHFSCALSRAPSSNLSTTAVVLGLVLTACGPLVMIPGGELTGSVKPIPQNWKFSDAIDTVQLETRPGDPYSVNIWGVGLGEAFYVAAGDAESRWASFIAEDPRVRLKLNDDLYELNAVRVTDEAELDGFLTAVQRKYDFEVEPGQREKAAVFLLSPR
jgi:hypothetical protein